MSHRLTPRIAALTLLGTVAAGSLGIAGAAAASGGDGGGPTGDKAAKVCANIDQIDDWMNSRIAEVQHRIEYFTTMRAKAEAAGRTNLVTRIDRALTRLNDRLTRLQNRLTQVDAWAAANCTAATTTTTPEPSTTVAEEPTTTVAEEPTTTAAG